MLRYIELKTGYADNGPAWIGGVQLSRSGRTIYFDGKALKRGSGASSNHFDKITNDEYWISGIKKNGQDRHWAGNGKITIEAAVVDEYLKITGATSLDRKRFVVSKNIKPTDPSMFYAAENVWTSR
jgi:hypothetical protein